MGIKTFKVGIGLFLTVLLLLPGIISTAERTGMNNGVTCENSDRYELFNKTYFMFGKLAVNETFTTSMDGKVIGMGLKSAGRYFTGQGHIRLYDEEKPRLYGAGDSCVYVFGIIVLPWDLWINDDDFTPGLQTLVLKAWGLGWFTLVIYGES
ncbi:MAG: hypothetical protein J7L93_01270 [Thermoplasmata archaeon]|nr:hypothetical protein [Thermoplasmata archaeon]